MKIVLDTNVLVAASRSRTGGSFRLVSQIPSPRFTICLSLNLYLEWQEVLTRPENIPPGQAPASAAAFLRYLASQADPHEIYYSWRPFLPDCDDDMLLELAFSARCAHIVTHNVKDFAGSDQLGVSAITPREFLKRISL